MFNVGNKKLNGEQPDPDCIKMFVGNLPNSMNREQLKKIFEQYGRVYEIFLIREKATGVSAGCCFLTFFTRRAAFRAKEDLHNVKGIVGMCIPIQMTPAETRHRRIFVGKLNKTLNANDVRKLFGCDGTIEDCRVLRHQNGQSKGCAVVTFFTKQSAISAMEHCSWRLTLEFSDTKMEKQRKIMKANLCAAYYINEPLVQTATSMTTPMLANPAQQASPCLGADAITPASLQQLGAVGLQQQQLLQDTAMATAAAEPAHELFHPIIVQNLAARAVMTQPATNNAALLWLDPNPWTSGNNSPQPVLNVATTTQPASGQLPSYAELLWSDRSPWTSYIPQTTGFSPFGSSTLSASPLASVALTTEAPKECNLFFSNLPEDFNATNLALAFLPFGNVISAKVFLIETNLSNYFGIVSFENHYTVQAVIKALNGFH